MPPETGKPVSRSSTFDTRPARIAAAPVVDLGLEAPLYRDGEQTRHDRRSISMRWLAGTVLTGLFGATLIGSAIWVSLDGEVTFAKRAELSQTPAGRSAAGSDRSPRRGDRLFVATEIVSAKQSFRTPTTIRVGDREVIKVKPFVRVATNLALGSLGFTDEIPPFNPVSLYAAGGDTGERAPEAEATEGDAAVSFQRRPLAGYGAAPDSGVALTQDQVEAQVAEQSRSLAARQPLPLPQSMLGTAFAVRAQPEAVPQAPGIAFSTMQVTFVPENVTTRPKTPAPPKEATKRAGPDERLVTVKRNETLEQVLRVNGAQPSEVRSVLAALAARLRDNPVREGSRLKLLFGPGGEARPGDQLLRVMTLDGDTVTAIAAVNDRSEFVAVAPPQTETAAEEDEEAEEPAGGIRLYDSLYETALKQEVPKSVIDQLVRIYFYDFDLQRRTSGGDNFEVFYAEDEDGGPPEVLYAALSVSGQTKRYFRFQLGDENVVDFFDESGKSNRKFLVRKPIAEGQLRSTFGLRYHPILRYSRMHTGIDWANRIGTPIVAAGDGRIRSAGWDSGYGRRVEIEHQYNFVTTYSHMSGFARGIRDGVRVRQGQVIGYLGNSGLSTGPHLHYEVMINENFVDPLGIKLPRNRELDAAQLASFQRSRDRIQDLISKAPTTTKLAERVPR